MKVLCTSEFYEIHLKLLPKFLKISPLCRKYFGIEEGGLLPSLFQNDEIRGYSFQFLNPFSEEEADWLDDFVRKIKLQPTDPGISSAVDIGVNLHPKLIHHLHLILTHLKVYSKCFYLWITSLFLPPLLV